MAFNLSQSSLTKLDGVHPKLVKVVKRAIEITTVDFKINEGVRTVSRQKQLVAAGASKTMNSRHITGHAVDLIPLLDVDGDGKIETEEMFHWPLFLPLAVAMQKASAELRIPIRWGGTWKLLSDTPKISMGLLHKKFPDGPHFELPA